MYRIIIMTLLIFTTNTSYGQNCNATKWPYKEKQKASEFHKLFQLQSFEGNLSYLANEVKSKNISELEKYLFKYLSYNSPNKDIKGFLQAMQWSRVREDGKVYPIKEKDFCSLYKKTLALK